MNNVFANKVQQSSTNMKPRISRITLFFLYSVCHSRAEPALSGAERAGIQKLFKYAHHKGHEEREDKEEYYIIKNIPLPITIPKKAIHKPLNTI
jgi:hypothetical protein